MPLFENAEIIDETKMGKPSTAKVYKSMLNQIRNLLNEENLTIDIIANNWSAIKNFIDEKDKLQTRRNYYKLIMSLTKGLRLYEIAEENFKKLSEEMDKQQDTQEKKESEEILTRNELNEKIQEFKDELPEEITEYKEYRKLMRYLLVLIHSEYPVRNDLAGSKIFFSGNYSRTELRQLIETEKKNERNFILVMEKIDQLSPSYIYMADYKTVKVYGPQTFVLDPNKNILNELIKYKATITSWAEQNVWLINEQGAPMTRNNLTQFLKRSFASSWKEPSKISTSSLRKTAVSNVHDPKKGQRKQIKELAQVMMHSPATAAKFYSKVL